MVVIKRQLCVSFFGNTQEGEEGNTDGEGKVRSKCKWNSGQGCTVRFRVKVVLISHFKKRNAIN